MLFYEWKTKQLLNSKKKNTTGTILFVSLTVHIMFIRRGKHFFLGWEETRGSFYNFFNGSKINSQKYLQN